MKIQNTLKVKRRHFKIKKLLTLNKGKGLKTGFSFFQSRLEEKRLRVNDVFKFIPDTMVFFRKRLGFKKPSRVLLDGSIFYYLTKNNLDFQTIKNLINDNGANLFTTECVLREMKYLYRMYSGSKAILKSIRFAKRLHVECCRHPNGVNAETCIRSYVGINNPSKIFVATTVNSSWPLIDKNPSIPIITKKKGSLVLKQFSSEEQRLAQKWFPHSRIKKGNCLKDSPSYRRLQNRLQFYGYEGKIVVTDGNCQYKAITEQLKHLKLSYKKVRKDVVNQLLLHSELYKHFVDPPEGANADLTYLEFVNCTAQNGEWGDEYTLQAAADFYDVNIVVLTSLKRNAKNDFFPHGVLNPKKQVLYLSCLNNKYYNTMYLKSGITSTCKLLYKQGDGSDDNVLGYDEDEESPKKDDDSYEDNDLGCDEDEETTKKDGDFDHFSEVNVPGSDEDEEIPKNDASFSDDNVVGNDKDEQTPKKQISGKKRPNESSSKTPSINKKAKMSTPQKKIDGKKAGGHVATYHPSKKSGTTSATSKSNQKSPACVAD